MCTVAVCVHYYWVTSDEKLYVCLTIKFQKYIAEYSHFEELLWAFSVHLVYSFQKRFYVIRAIWNGLIYANGSFV